MRTISVRDLQKKIKEAVDSAQGDRVVVTRRGKPAAVLYGVEGKDWESVVLETSSEFWELIQRRRADPSLSREELAHELDGESSSEIAESRGRYLEDRPGTRLSPAKADLEVVGVDGSKGGWVAAVARRGRVASISAHPSLAEVAAAYPAAAVIGIDIPLAMPAVGSARATDREAKRLLGEKSASLFLTQPREILAVDDYAEANALARKLTGKGVSRQSFGLREKILEAQELLASTRDPRFWEVHPELSFHVLAESFGETITASKKTWNGLAERWQLLERVGFAPPLGPDPRLQRAAPDDVLDAAAAAWTAHRVATGEARFVVDVPIASVEKAPNGNPGVIRA